MRLLQIIYRRISWFSFAKIMAISGFVILLISVLWLVFVNKIFIYEINPIDIELASKIGGFIGGIIGVFWSGAGVILIYATFNKQQIFNTNQAFEQTFQNMMNSYHTIVNNTKGTLSLLNDHNHNSVEIRSFSGNEFYSKFLLKFRTGLNNREFIEALINNKNIPETEEFLGKRNIVNQNLNPYEDEFRAELNTFKVSDKGLSDKLIIFMYEFFYKEHHSILGHYFRFIYNTFKFIIENKTNETERNNYINLIQAHMSNDQLGILFYNALCKYSVNKKGINQFKIWLEDYQFFENIDENSLFSKNDCKHYNINYKYINC